MRVFQYIDEYRNWDGICNDIKGIQRVLHNESIESFIITQRNYSGSEFGIFNPLSAPKSHTNDIHILHFGGSGYPLEDFRNKTGRKFLRFHNMTPSEFFYGCNIGVYLSMVRFYQISTLELASLSGEIEMCIAVSDYNSETLRNITEIPSISIPIFLPYKLPTPDTYRIVHRKWGTNECVQLCFISRFVPNKKIEDIISLLYFFKKIHNNSRLVLIGSVVPGIQDYYEYLLKLVADLNLQDSIEFRISVNEDEKKSILRNSDFFVSMSEHEGFGIPVLEAMQEGVPVLAYDSSAISETMNQGGILFRTKDYPRIAELIFNLMENPSILVQILNSQWKAMQYYANYPYTERILSILKVNNYNSRSI